MARYANPRNTGLLDPSTGAPSDPMSAGATVIQELIAPYVDYLEAINDRVDLHIQAEPVCQPRPGTITVAPIARQLRETRAAVRERLQVGSDLPLVLVSMGGVPAQYPFLKRLRDRRDAVYLIPGAAAERGRDGALLALPTRSDFYHPDLVNACDALVCKAGYSTLAEAFQAGVPLAWFPRERFPESPALVSGCLHRPRDAGNQAPAIRLGQRGLDRSNTRPADTDPTTADHHQRGRPRRAVAATADCRWTLGNGEVERLRYLS